MQTNKKLTTIAIISLLMLSMLAVAAPAFAALPSFTVTATPVDANPIVGTKVVITGTGGSPGSLIQMYWDNLGGALLNSSYASGDVAADFSCNANIPDAANGVHYIIAYDVATGSTSTTGPIFINAAIVASPTTGIPSDIITVNGTGFVASKSLNVTFYNTTGTTIYSLNVTQAPNRSGTTGNFSTTFVVPAVDYGIYTINITQTTGTTIVANASTSFNVNSTITLNPTSGPQGSVVAITGRGFNVTAGAPITVSIASGGVNIPLKVVTPITTAAGGTFSGSFVLNTTLTGTLTINASDRVNVGAATFRVRGITSITVTPTSGQPGATIAITGSNFTAIAGTSVAIQFATLPLMTLTTDAVGSISGTFAVPSLPTTAYTITATDTNGLTASKNFTIAITYVTVTPTSGVTGSSMLVTAYGFTAGGTANATLGTKILGTTSTVPTYNVAVNTLQATGISFVVPQLAQGSYTLTVVDNLGLTGTTSFAVTQTSQLIATPSSAPASTTVSVAANYFGQSTSITFTFKNATATYATTVTTTNATGQAVVSLDLPSSLALGSYIINATDAQGFTVEIAFNVIPATLNINPRSTTYSQGDIASFRIQSSFATTFNINVYDPEGTPITIVISSGSFVLSGSLYVYPYSSGQMWGYTVGSDFVIPNDAVIGTWTWNATTLGTTKSGNFTVKAVSSDAFTNINTKLDAINSTLLGIGANVTSIKGTVVTIQTATGTIQTSLAAINATVIAINGNVATLSTSIGTINTNIAAVSSSVSGMSSTVSGLSSTLSGISGSITSVNSGIATVQTTLGTVNTKLGNLDAVLGAVAGQNAEIQTSLGTITTSLTSIGTTVTKIDGNVATIQTSLGTLTGTVTSISNGVATIQTSLGTMQTSLGTLQTDVTSTKDSTASLSPLVIVAIVLALVAAIAAIASIVLMRRKIAG
jgi:prefoldin subunit 5